MQMYDVDSFVRLICYFYMQIYVNGICIFCMYNSNGKTEFPFFYHVETEFMIFRNGKGNFLKRKITAPKCAARKPSLKEKFIDYGGAIKSHK